MVTTSQSSHTLIQVLASTTTGTERITADMLTNTIHEAIEQKTELLPYLLNTHYLDGTKFTAICANYFELPQVNLLGKNKALFPIEVLLPEFIQQHSILPFYKDSTTLHIALADPNSLRLVDEIVFQTELKVKPFFSEYQALITTINQLISAKLYHKTNNQTQVVHFIEQVISDAISRLASDIHFEPFHSHYSIRIRVDGLLHEATSQPITLGQTIASRLKIMANLDIAQRRLPQDGRFKFTTPQGITRDCRLNSCPTLFGEKLVVRILDSNKKLLSLSDLGLEKTALSNLKTTIKKPQGLILVTGPTGSGKTITLYSALNQLNTMKKNISTVEDPVEIQLSGINQINVNYKINLNFAIALRAILRQDPDIIMVGEIRDLETAEMAIRAAHTGHLVLSTLHTNSAAEAVLRLLNMGIAPYNLTNSISLIIAQRLIRKLCPHCKTAIKLPANTLIDAGFDDAKLHSITLYQPQQCTLCIEGYHGRSGVFEVMRMTSEISNGVLNHLSASNLTKIAKQQGMNTLWQAGITKVKAGITSLDELYRVIIQ